MKKKNLIISIINSPNYNNDKEIYYNKKLIICELCRTKYLGKYKDGNIITWMIILHNNCYCE